MPKAMPNNRFDILLSFSARAQPTSRCLLERWRSPIRNVPRHTVQRNTRHLETAARLRTRREHGVDDVDEGAILHGGSDALLVAELFVDLIGGLGGALFDADVDAEAWGQRVDEAHFDAEADDGRQRARRGRRRDEHAHGADARARRWRAQDLDVFQLDHAQRPQGQRMLWVRNGRDQVVDFLLVDLLARGLRGFIAGASASKIPGRFAVDAGLRRDGRSDTSMMVGLALSLSKSMVGARGAGSGVAQPLRRCGMWREETRCTVRAGVTDYHKQRAAYTKSGSARPVREDEMTMLWDHEPSRWWRVKVGWH
nr:hypothetical protein CFP56_66165 [Quercus suber]